ncbi:DUF2207 domain-containing protein [Klebsiella pneumoniae]
MSQPRWAFYSLTSLLICPKLTSGDRDMTNSELEALYKSAINFVFAIGKFDFEYLKKGMQINDDDASQLIEKMISHGAISDRDESGNYTPLKTYIHSDYLLQQELKNDTEKVKDRRGEKNTKRENLLIIFFAMAIFVVTCLFALREPISLIFIVGCFVLISYFFLWLGQKAQFNQRLSKPEQAGTLRFCAIGFLIFSAISNIGFLFWVDSKTPIFGDAYTERKHYENLKEDLRKQEIAEEEDRFSRAYDAKESVKSTLKDSSSAEFSGEREGIGGAVCGYVNAKNSFGAYAGKSRYISVGGQSVIDDGSQSFGDLWEKTCN